MNKVPLELRANLTNEEFVKLVLEADTLRAQRDELAAALRRFANLDKSVPSELWLIDAAYCEQARAALAKVSA